MASSQTMLVATSKKCPNASQSRPLAKFHPSIWNDRFIFYTPSLANTPYNSYSRKIQVLKEKVRDMLSEARRSGDLVKKVRLIDSLCRLGVSYHFEEEIEQELKRMFNAQPDMCIRNDYDLYTTSLVFRVFRQHGHRMSCEIFNKFKDDEGKFKESLASDTRGMLSLYEASQLRVHGEAILDEAIVFTTTRLKFFAQDDQPSHALTQQVLHALQQPLHKGIPRLESRLFIDFYQQDENRDDALLEFAKLDFNLLQLLHQQELGLVQRWWKDLNVASKLSYSRDRIVEGYFWMFGLYDEPQYSRARINLAKIAALLTLIDDTYDAYATFKEIKLFTDAVERWESSAMEQLPEYMCILYNILLSVYEEIEKDVTEEGRSYAINYAKEAMKGSVRGYHQEAEWLEQDYVMSFNEYFENALMSSSCEALAISSLVDMKSAGRDELDWIQARPVCVKSCQIIGRLLDDIMSHKFEQERKHIASSMECYMSEYGVSEEEAVSALSKMVDDAWKDLNEECLDPTAVSMHILVRVLNLTRSMDVVYKFGDGYTEAERDLKAPITLMFIDPISINDSE